jgi:hypothetical protein
MINNAFVLEDGGGQTTGQVGIGAPSSTVTSFLVNQQGNGNLLQLQQNGVDRLLVQNDGSIDILASSTIATTTILTVQNGTTTLFAINAVGDVNTIGHITVGQDTAGTATVKAGDNQTTVTFAVPYDTLPKIAVTVQGLPNFFYGVATKTPEGFVIQTSQPVASDTSFDWIALAQPATSTSQSSLNQELQVASNPIGPIGQISPISPISSDSSATSSDASTASTTPATDQGQVAGTSTTATTVTPPATPPDTTNTAPAPTDPTPPADPAAPTP